MEIGKTVKPNPAQLNKTAQLSPSPTGPANPALAQPSRPSSSSSLPHRPTPSPRGPSPLPRPFPLGPFSPALAQCHGLAGSSPRSACSHPRAGLCSTASLSSPRPAPTRPRPLPALSPLPAAAWAPLVSCFTRAARNHPWAPHLADSMGPPISPFFPARATRSHDPRT